ncbi:hypothetical protein BH23PSE1_BH23PSE1_15530 [soil metagenome]
MKPMFRASAALLLLTMPLAACFEDSRSAEREPQQPQDQFGSTFAAAFNASESDEPINPRPGDAGELSRTTDPIDF